jgi:hypothetical protein
MEINDIDVNYNQAPLGCFEKQALHDNGKSWTICFQNEQNCSEIAVVTNYKKLPKYIDKIHDKGGMVVSIIRHFD